MWKPTCERGRPGGGHHDAHDPANSATEAVVPNTTPVSATEEVVPNITPVSATEGEETLNSCLVAEVTPLSTATAFHVVTWDPPPLAIIAPGFPPNSQLSAPLAPDVEETVDRVGVILEPNGHEMSVPPLCALSLATNRADRREGGSMNKKEAKLKGGKIRSNF